MAALNDSMKSSRTRSNPLLRHIQIILLAKSDRAIPTMFERLNNELFSFCLSSATTDGKEMVRVSYE